eukprot:CAMPEP_0170380856 /NCGR_PEP_ID=MMETSP0117_2-20130122/14101_1 /TAXON_ID=400756 /ORGANISM="Durinskia baltica, Strain CSIRO CS-38" /LENGTH=221 /DNA_ID=CAMNT_0010636393 /DNA_START=55 /DNA_END=717 /DNA_ORIENTATION=+
MGFGDASAKDKKAAKTSAADATAKKQAEDASWNDDDKGASKKAARAAAKEDKADAKASAKKEREELEAAENEANAKLSGANKKASTGKVTQAEIARRQALLALAKAAPKKKADSVPQPKLEENRNRQTDEDVEASGIDAALNILGASEKKGKMTYKEFEAKVLPDIQAENPGLKMSQAKDKAFKMWERAPENPKNQENERAADLGTPVTGLSPLSLKLCST